MAFNVCEKQERNASSSKFFGFGTFKVIAINPNQQQFEDLFGRKVQEWKGYLSTDAEGNPRLRVMFVLQDVTPDSKLPLVQATYFISRKARRTQDGTRTQVIDAYGNAAWVTDDQFANQAIPQSKTGKPLSIIPPYKPACEGQERLISFLKAWLYTPNSHRWDDALGGFVAKDAEQLSRCTVELEHIKDYWNGDLSELQSLLTNPHMQDHSVKALLTIREGEYNGSKSFTQNVFWKVVPDYGEFATIEKEYVREQQNGMHQNERTVFQDAVLFTPTQLHPAPGATSFAPVAPMAQQPAANPYPSFQPVQTPAQPAAPDTTGCDPNELPF